MKVDRSRLTAVEGGHGHRHHDGRAPLDDGTVQPSPFMQSSLPTIAAGFDQYVRQFYDRFNVPQQRILPVGIPE